MALVRTQRAFQRILVVPIGFRVVRVFAMKKYCVGSYHTLHAKVGRLVSLWSPVLGSANNCLPIIVGLRALPPLPGSVGTVVDKVGQSFITE